MNYILQFLPYLCRKRVFFVTSFSFINTNNRDLTLIIGEELHDGPLRNFSVQFKPYTQEDLTW